MTDTPEIRVRCVLFRVILRCMDGDWIKTGRAALGRLSQKQLADRVGVTERTIQNWEGGGAIRPGDRALLEALFREADTRASVRQLTKEEVLASASDEELINALASRLARLRSQIPNDRPNAGIEAILASSDLDERAKRAIRNEMMDTRSGEDTTDS